MFKNMVKPGCRQIHLLNFSDDGNQRELLNEGEKRIIKTPKLQINIILMRSILTWSMPLTTCWMHVHAKFVVHPEGYETNFLKLFTLFIYKKRQKPKISVFQLLQTENSLGSCDAKVGLPVWISEPRHMAAFYTSAYLH